MRLMFDTQRPLFEPLEFRRLLSSVSLDFNGGAGGLADSGFTSTLPSSNGGTFISSKVGVSGGLLRITSTKGDLFSSHNNQDDALDTPLDASQDFVVQTRIINFPFKRSSQSAGIFVGTNEDNYVKFVVGDLGHPGMQLGSEINGKFTALPVPAISFSGIQTLDLRITGDASTDTLTAQFRVNSSSDSDWVTYGQVTNGVVFSAAANAGIVTTNDGTRKKFTIGFDSFSAENEGVASAAPSIPSGPLSVGSTVNATRLPQSQVDAQVAVNPTNSQNLVVIAQTAETQNQIPVSYSFNGGLTWNFTTISGTTDGLSPANPRVDPRVAFDSFGNLYVSYEVAASSSEIRVVVARSSNGGASFTQTSTAVGGAHSNIDYPTIATGPAAGNPSLQAVWITYTDYANPNSLQVKAVNATSSGLGQLSKFSSPMLVSRVANTEGDLADVAVDPNGQVAVAYEADDTETGPDQLYVATDANGASGSFTDHLAATTNVGPYLAIPAQPNRTIFALQQLAFDRSNDSTRGRLYFVYTTATQPGGTDTNIELSYSNNLGSSFSAPIQVNDDKTTNSQFLPALSVDPISGDVGISWLDARNSAQNNTVQEYATVSTNHGTSVLPNVRVSAGTSNEAATNDADMDFGDYNGAAFFNSRLIVAWPDDSDTTGDNLNGASSFDIYTAAVTVNP